LVLKFSYDKKDFEVNAELFDLIESAENIYHISDMLSKSEINDLIAQSDTLISLHRSEGFGRVIAEAMLLNTQVVCTNYSGNLAFCNESNSLLVGYDLIPVEGSQYPFSAGLMWADVNFDSAVLKIKQAFTDLEGRVRREKCAYDTVIRNHSIDSAKTVIGCRVKALLEVISKGAK
jgi:glycosyltransferase involved in cell wall biosynthesis